MHISFQSHQSIKQSLILPKAEVFGHIHNTISTFESLSSEKKYRGSQQKLFHLIDKCSSYRPAESVIRLLEYRAKDLYPTKSGWITGLHSLMDKYYRYNHIILHAIVIDGMESGISFLAGPMVVTR